MQEETQQEQQEMVRPTLPLAQAQENLINAAALLEKFVRNRALTRQQRETLVQVVRGLTALALEATALLAQAEVAKEQTGVVS